MDMFKRILLLVLLLLAGCSPALPALPSAQPPTVAVPVAQPPLETAPATPDTAGAVSCADADVSALAASIAKDYPFTTTDEVLVWFCNGAEFEDILLALETESLTEVPAEDMLSMLAGGMTWNEIWQAVGLSD